MLQSPPDAQHVCHLEQLLVFRALPSQSTNRFTNDQTHIKNYAVRLGKYDGIHLYSQEGALALTSSLLAILHKAGMVRRPQQWGLSSSSSSSANQWTRQVRGRGFRGNNGNYSAMALSQVGGNFPYSCTTCFQLNRVPHAKRSLISYVHLTTQYGARTFRP